MAHFAKIDADGTVLDIIVVSDRDAPDPAPQHSEPIGQAFIASLDIEGTWIQTSYNGKFRKQYAWIGGKYIADADVFVLPQPYPSWILDENYDWQPPVPIPDIGHGWAWDENRQEWVDQILLSNEDS